MDVPFGPGPSKRAASTRSAPQPPHFKDFARDEKELKARLAQWIGETAIAGTRPVLAAYQNDKRRFIEDSFNQLLFEEPVRVPNLLVKTLLNTMDPFSTYFSSKEFQDFYYDLAGGSTGIGVKIRKVPQGLLIEKLIKDSSAGLSHRIHEGDIITAVDEISLRTLPSAVAKSLLRGPENTRVKLVAHRPNGDKDVLTLSRKHFSFEESRVTLPHEKSKVPFHQYRHDRGP